MSREADNIFPDVDVFFDPPLYTVPELEFIKAHLGETSFVALESASPDEPGVAEASQEDAVAANRMIRRGKRETVDNPSSMRGLRDACGKALQRFYDLNESAKHHGQEWHVFNMTGDSWPGFQGVKNHIDFWIRRQELFQERKENDPQRKGFHPELWTIRGGQPIWSGRGTHSERVRYPLALVPQGRRVFDDYTEIAKQEVQKPEPAPEVETAPTTADPYEVDQIKWPTLDEIKGERGFQCPVEGCMHVSEFDPDSLMAERRAEHGLKIHMSRPKGKFKTEEHQAAKAAIF